jgi:hypothetical protein
MEIFIYMVFPLIIIIIAIRFGYLISNDGHKTSYQTEWIYSILLVTVIFTTMLLMHYTIKFETQRQNAIECYKERTDTRCFIFHLYSNNKTVELNLEGTSIIIKE